MTPPWFREAEVTEADGDGPGGGHVEQTSRPSGLGFLLFLVTSCLCITVPGPGISPKLGHHLTMDVHGEVTPAPDAGARRPWAQSRAGAVNTIVSCWGCGQRQFSPRSPSSGLCAGCWGGQGACETVR